MRRAKKIDEDQKESLRVLLGKTKSKADFRRVLCVWLRAALDLSPMETGTAVGWSASTVKIVQSRYMREGESALLGKGRGGRRYSNLSEEQEEVLLSSFLDKARSGGVIVVGEIKVAYEKAVGKRVPKSTVYRMLARHGWRKIAPRPRHPKGDPASQEAFKKNSPRLSRKR